MAKIFKDQTALTLTLSVEGFVYSGLETCLIKYINPNKDTGQLTASINEDNQLFYDFDLGELDVAGTWTFWSHITFDDTTFVAGEPVSINVYEEGKI